MKSTIIRKSVRNVRKRAFLSCNGVTWLDGRLGRTTNIQ